MSTGNDQSLRRFELGLDEFKKQIRDRGVLFVKRVVFMVLGGYVQMADGSLRAHSGLLQLTPVDTGRAVGNWQVSVGAPITETVSAEFGKSGGSSEANRAIGTRMATKQATGAISGIRFGQNVWITNSLPYIVVLNDGAANRTAHHMAERAIDNTLSSLRSEKS